MNREIDFEELTPWLVILITIFGGWLRVLLLDSKGMWLDETFSVWLANHSIDEMLQWIVKIDQHPPLYYFLLHFWMKFNGDAPYNVRLLSVLFGTGTIPIIYLIGKRMSGRVMGLAAAAILAFSPYHIFFAQEARMYTLLTFNAAIAMYALVRLFTDPRSVRPIGIQFRDYLRAWRTSGLGETDIKDEFSYQDKIRNRTGWRAWISRHRLLPIRTIETDLAWVAFIVFSAATMLSHNTAVLFPLATTSFVLGLMLYQKIKKSGAQPAFQAPSFGNWVKAQIGIFILWSPWLLTFIKQAGAVDQRFWIPEPTWDAVLQTIKFFLNASAPLPASLSMLIWSLFVLLLGLGVVQLREKVSQFLFLATLFAVPFLGELIVSIRRPIFYDRTLIWTTIPLFLVLAAGAVQLRFRILIIGVVGFLCTINLFSAADYYRFFPKEDWQTAAGYVANFAGENDLILFNSNFVVIPFDYYFESYENQYHLQVEKIGIPEDLLESGILEPEMTESDIPRLIALLSGHDRVWLVYSHDFYTDPMGLIPQTLTSEMTLIRQRDFYGGQVQLYGIDE